MGLSGAQKGSAAWGRGSGATQLGCLPQLSPVSPYSVCVGCLPGQDPRKATPGAVTAHMPSVSPRASGKFGTALACSQGG